MSTDPYASPAANLSSIHPQSAGAISQGVIQQLAGTKPWVRLISVMIFIGAGLMLLVALVMLVAGGAMAKASSNPMFSGGMGVGMAIFYAAFSFLYIYPGIKLWKYATYIGILMTSGTMFDLEMALGQQRSFWKFIGVITLIILSLYALIIVGAILVGGFAALNSGKN